MKKCRIDFSNEISSFSGERMRNRNDFILCDFNKSKYIDRLIQSIISI